MKRMVPIDQLLVWAFKDGENRPPERRDSLAKISEHLLDLRTRVDASIHVDMLEMLDTRHPDAKVIQAAVVALCNSYQTIEEEEDREPIPRLNWTTQGEFFLGPLWSRLSKREIINHGARQDECGALIDGPGINPGAFVLTHAMNGGYPRWNFGEQIIPVEVRKGSPPRTRLVCEDENGKLKDISPVEIARARFDYHVWWQAISSIADSLPKMRDFEATHPDAPYSPWLGISSLNRYDHMINEDIHR